MPKWKQFSYKDIEQIIQAILRHDTEFLMKWKDKIVELKDLDNYIKTRKEHAYKITIPEGHCPKRIAIFLLNYYGEQYCAGRTLTIKHDDDLHPTKPNFASHDNTYRLILKDRVTHECLLEHNMTGAEYPYDFDSIFEKQITIYRSGTTSDTTKTAWDSFHKNKKGYMIPKRTFDFKSCFWNIHKPTHTHYVDYIIHLSISGELGIFANNDVLEPKDFMISEPTEDHIKYLLAYKDLAVNINKLGRYTWDEIININEDYVWEN